ncbi:unnamed protein product [Orchesella dallaii]|uniref:Transcription factor CBF/NF-Y/archaeal histone domain-containing protein n=1 Tax=Orchesella dallaii TaxID=48710 RepID=A0ABP1QPM8_9HEXA
MEIEENSVRIESSEPQEVSTVVSSGMEEENTENSMSILNEGFVIGSDLISFTASNDESNLVEPRNDSELEGTEKSTDMDLEDNTEFFEEDVIENPEPESLDATETELPEDSEPLEVDLEEDDDDDNENSNSITTQLPMHRIKKIMKICLATTEEEEPEAVTSKSKNSKGSKGKGAVSAVMINKEAMYLTTLATEYFIAAIGDMAGRLTVSSKKKTMTMEHLKRVLSDSETFDFLQGCFQPSVIIGD